LKGKTTALLIIAISFILLAGLVMSREIIYQDEVYKVEKVKLIVGWRNETIINETTGELVNISIPEYKWYYNLTYDGMEILTPVNTVCYWNGSKTRTCVQPVTIRLKRPVRSFHQITIPDDRIFSSEFEHPERVRNMRKFRKIREAVNSTNETNGRRAMLGGRVSRRPISNDVIRVGDEFNITYEFEYPANTGEEWNLTFLLDQIGLDHLKIDPTISACSYLNAPGVYDLDSDILDYSGDCFIINSSDIEFDCNLHTISSDGTSDISAFKISSGSGDFDNVSIYSCDIDDYYYCFYLFNVSNVSIFDNDINNCTNIYIRWDTYNVSVYGNIMNNTSFKIGNTNNFFIEVYNNTITDIGILFGVVFSDYGNLDIHYNRIFGKSGSELFDFAFADNDTLNLYNNLLNDTGDISLTYRSTNLTFNLNITKQEGTRIYGKGKYIGGNYWTNSTGGFSDTCTDSDNDGICDSSYDPYGDGVTFVDYLPLSDEAILNVPYINSTTEPTDPSTYSSGASYNFEAQICDDDGFDDIDIVNFEFDGVNYTLTATSNTSVCGNFNKTIYDLPAGTYTWVWHVNDSTGEYNSTSDTFTITKASSTIQGYLNEEGTTLIWVSNNTQFLVYFNITPTLLTLNFTSNMTGVADNYSTTGEFMHNYTSYCDGSNVSYYMRGFTDGNENYTSAELNLTVWCDTEAPVLSNNNPPGGGSVVYASSTQTYEFRIDATDDIYLKNVTLEINGNNYTASLEAGNTYLVTVVGLSPGVYPYTWRAIDNASNTANYTGNFSVVEASSGGGGGGGGGALPPMQIVQENISMEVTPETLVVIMKPGERRLLKSFVSEHTFTIINKDTVPLYIMIEPRGAFDYVVEYPKDTIVVNPGEAYGVDIYGTLPLDQKEITVPFRIVETNTGNEYTMLVTMKASTSSLLVIGEKLLEKMSFPLKFSSEAEKPQFTREEIIIPSKKDLEIPIGWAIIIGGFVVAYKLVEWVFLTYFIRTFKTELGEILFNVLWIGGGLLLNIIIFGL